MLNYKLKHWLWTLPTMALVILILLVIIKPQPALKYKSTNVPVVVTETVRLTQNTPYVTGYGRVVPKESWLALSEVSGPVIYRHPDLERGQRLKAGMDIIKIDPVDYELKLAQAKSDLSSAKAELARTELKEEKLKLTLELEQQQLTIIINELHRKERLLKNDSISKSSVDLEKRNVILQKQKVLDIENSIKQFPSDLEVAKAKVALAEIRLFEAQRKLDKTTITLPFDAQVADVDVELQQIVKEGQVLVSAHRVNTMEIPVQVSLSDMRNFARFLGASMDSGTKVPNIKDLNLTAEVKLYIGDETFKWFGKVVNVGESIEPQGNTVTLIIDVDMKLYPTEPSQQPPLIKDMFVEVKIFGESMELISIPADSVRGEKVYVLTDDNTLLIRPIEIAFEDQGQAIVTSGLKQGEKLITTDIIPAIPGMVLSAYDD